MYGSRMGSVHASIGSSGAQQQSIARHEARDQHLLCLRPAGDFEGPYTILKALPKGNYVLGDLRSRRMHEVINEERLMPWPTRRLDPED